MEQNRFEDIVRSTLREHEADVPAHLWDGIAEALPRQPKTVRMRTVYRYAAACAALLFLAGSGVYFWMTDTRTAHETAVCTGSDERTCHDMSLQGAGSRTAHETAVCTGSDERTCHDMSLQGAGDWTAHETQYISPVRKTTKRRGITIGLMASNALPENKNALNEPLTRSSMILNNNLQLYQAEEPLKFMHKTPLSFGLTVEKRLPRHWGIESGVVYTLLRSDYRTPSRSRQGKQEFHYIGIPLNAIYRFASVSRVSFYAAAGGEADFNISGRRIEDVHSGNKVVKQTEDIRDRHVQWSVHVKAGAACTLFKTTELYAEPGVSYYIDNSNLPNLWKDHPVNFTVQLGWRTLF